MLELTWQGQRVDVDHVREVVFAALGSMAESATYLRQFSPAAGPLVFEIATGMIGADTPFAPHGHTLRFEIEGVPSPTNEPQ